MSFALSFALSACAHDKGEVKNQSTNMAPQASSSQPVPSREWPHEFTSESHQYKVYQPEVEKWTGNQIEQRAAVSAQTVSSSHPTYGMIWMSAHTETDPNTHEVVFKDVKVTRASFPSAPELTSDLLTTLRQHSSEILKPVSSERLKSSLAVVQTESKQRPTTLKNEPPKIILSDTPAVLVLIDGKPVLRETDAKDVLRIINTRALVLFDSSSNKYFFFMANRWMEASSLEGPWAESKNPPSSLEQIKHNTAAKNLVDLLDEPGTPLMKELNQGSIPKVVVSMVPAELIQMRGTPQYQSIANTKLLYVSNSDDNIFLNQIDQNYYVLISGRWYRASSLSGPWKYVSAKKLPGDFAKIPENHRKGTVLSSVAGTAQAGEARIQNEVPQTAEVDRNQATLNVNYDGAPQFKPIEKTSLKYAVNTPIPVIEVNSSSYYALRSGVWFEAKAAQGPWSVATQVPQEIYTIPPSSPLYYVTYVRIYGSTPDRVYTGYTAGYLGSYCCSDGVVVYGTGYYYPPWIGTVWIGPPVTFGFGFTWGPYGGFFAGPAFYPWWGPWWGPWWAGPVYYGYPYVVTPANAPPSNVYQGWSTQAVNTPHPAAFENAYTGSGGQWGAATPPAYMSNEISKWNPPPAAPSTNAAPWGMSQAGTANAPPPMSVAPPIAAPAAPAASAGAGHAGAMSQGFSGGGWGGHK